MSHLNENIESGLRTLFTHGWGSDICYQEAAKLAGDLPEGYERTFKDMEHLVRENYHVNRCVRLMLDNAVPSPKKAGVFEVNNRPANPMDGHSLRALESVFRSYLDLSGKLMSMEYSLDQVLTVDNAQSFFSDWANAKEGVPVTVRGIGDELPLYFTPSSENGTLPRFDAEATKEALEGRYESDKLTDSIDVIGHSLEGPKSNLDQLLSIRQAWGRVFTRSPQELSQGV